jgi:transcriptional regulator with GAF, ATPase, and Fis domain
VLITGETGTGKEVLARLIHNYSPRATKTFLPFNCTATPRDMLDSQLFGHRRGAFTGAMENFSGVIRAASGGTLFLDEIGESTLDIQPKLLRFLESGEVHPIGETHPQRVDVRVIAATNADVDMLVSQGRFREDLFYRLNIVRLHMPPLRERRVEIRPLPTTSSRNPRRK